MSRRNHHQKSRSWERFAIGFSLALVPVLTLGCDGEPVSEKQVATKAPAEQAPAEQAPAEQAPAETSAVATKTSCTAEKTWFTDPKMPDGSVFPSNKDITNCDFHRWSVQTFLYLTSEDKTNKQTVFEGFANPAELFVPRPKDAKRKDYPTSQSTEMLPRKGKSATSADIDAVFQAGPGNEILVDQAGEVVYYANHLNQQYWDFAENKKLWDLATLEGIPSVSGEDYDFPVDALELKSSWRVAEKEGKVLIPDAASRFYVVETTIPVVEVDGDGDIVQTGKTVKAKMALVGLHVTGIVAHHPEFIWATFEHVDNAPDCATLSATNPATKSAWSLYDGKATREQCNQFDPNNPLGPVNVCRAQPQGRGSDTNIANIVSIDAALRGITAGTVWANYGYVGAIWTTGKIPLDNPSPPANPNEAEPKDSDLRGSSILANTTLETFKQDENCFSCHNSGVHEVTVGVKTSRVGGKHINLSHFVVNYQATQMAKASK